MRMLAKIGCSLAVVATVATSGACSRNNIEAVNLAIEGDKAKAETSTKPISKYEQAVQLDPTSHRIMWKLALAYHKKEEWQKVASTCASAEKLAPTFANYYFEHGYALEQARRRAPPAGRKRKRRSKQAIQKDPICRTPSIALDGILLLVEVELNFASSSYASDRLGSF